MHTDHPNVPEPDKPQTNMLLTSLPIILFTIDRVGIITFAEGQGLQRLGIPSEHLVGQPVAHICHTFFPQDAEDILRHVQRAFDGDSLHSVGTAGHIVFDTQYEQLRDEHGSIIGVTGVALDITDQTWAKRELAEARSRLAESEELQQLRLAVEQLTQSTRASSSNIPLTDREINLMRLLVAGKTNQSISQELEITRRTVTNRLNAVMEKLGVNSRAEAICRIVELGLIKD